MITTPDSDSKDINMINSEEGEEGEIPKDSWMNQIIDYLQDSKLPEDKNKARNLRLKVVRYVLLEGK